MMTDGTSTATVSFGKCPACQLSITATIAYATTLGSSSFSNEVVTATLKPTGVYLARVQGRARGARRTTAYAGLDP